MELRVKVISLRRHPSIQQTIVGLSDQGCTNPSSLALIGVLSVPLDDEVAVGDVLCITIGKVRPLPSEPPPAWSRNENHS